MTEQYHYCSTCGKKRPDCGHTRKVGDMDGYCMDWKPNNFQSNGVKK